VWWTVSSMCRRVLLVLGSAGADCYRIVTCSGLSVAESAEGVAKLAAQSLDPTASARNCLGRYGLIDSSL
jgi:hypothetical protein